MTTTEVLLDLVVHDKRGRQVKNLKAGEVEIYEDGVRQQILSFRPAGSHEAQRGVEVSWQGQRYLFEPVAGRSPRSGAGRRASGHLVAPMVGLLKDGNSQIRQMAISILANQGKAAVPHLIAALKDTDANVRYTAVVGLQPFIGLTFVFFALTMRVAS